ncbi:NAD(P)H-dependent oxidoreductase [Flavobacterium sp.]|uniref:NAD(P)H-dependent oxidoreductase n=1 Tax=Flavobacterium sp. TaxID=239 RepID=UPI002636C0B7|nr:NAD(P)H-dependent oxidoreductase [Flavobacterium sp.]MDD2986900.1 NAD(P)H-dependent oxidoreductase [Flavobacterium sp.]
MNDFISNQKWRYATKKFDSSKKINSKDLAILKEAIQLSTSSYGLQPYKVFIIENQEIRAKIQPVAWGQSQIVDASHVIVFANMLNFGEEEIESYLRNLAETRRINIENIKPYGDFMKLKIIELPEETRNNWTSKQTYLALANLLNAAAELKIDVTPMEGFDPKAVNEILGLTEMGLNASLIATVGYRHADDATQHYAKVRKSEKELFINL